MVALFDPERIQYSEISFASNINRAINEIKASPREGFSTDLKLVINSVDIKLYPKAEVSKYHIYTHSVPKFLFFSNFGKEFVLYKGGKSVPMVKAWMQRQTRRLGNIVYQFKHDYQFDKTLYFFYYGGRDTEIYNHLDRHYWAKHTKLPIFHLMDFQLLKNIPCQGTNTTSENFVLLIQKNSTYSPCFCLSADSLEKTQYLLGNMTEYIQQTPDLDSVKIKDIRHFKPFILPLFENKE